MHDLFMPFLVTGEFALMGLSLSFLALWPLVRTED